MPVSGVELGCDLLTDGAWLCPVLGHHKSMQPGAVGRNGWHTEQKALRWDRDRESCGNAFTSEMRNLSHNPRFPESQNSPGTFGVPPVNQTHEIIPSSPGFMVSSLRTVCLPRSITPTLNVLWFLSVSGGDKGCCYFSSADFPSPKDPLAV